MDGISCGLHAAACGNLCRCRHKSRRLFLRFRCVSLRFSFRVAATKLCSFVKSLQSSHITRHSISHDCLAISHIHLIQLDKFLTKLHRLARLRHFAYWPYPYPLVDQTASQHKGRNNKCNLVSCYELAVMNYFLFQRIPEVHEYNMNLSKLESTFTIYTTTMKSVSNFGEYKREQLTPAI